jgi:sodium-dependent phosphate cotransporter
VQSSSSVTSLTVGLVAAGGLDVVQAIPIIMGSNMGTSVTNALVAAGHINKPAEFCRAFWARAPRFSPSSSPTSGDCIPLIR